ncbi:MAG: ATP-binding protein [Kiritimatiellae bacterium]|nr:ATP-binding protein [Kiritimatiellia bacterium]
MSRFIYVQAQADHIATLAKASPLAAIEELVWNALDADAREVKVDLMTNALGAVEGVKVSDNGTGIDILKADSTFGSLGGSWKRLQNSTTESKRRLHGRHGRGRFKAFALGTIVEWRTTFRAGNELVSCVISGNIENPGVFEITPGASPGYAPGTEVCIMNSPASTDSLLDAVETVQTLAAKFALYLTSYPDVRIFFNGLPVTPLIMQRSVETKELKVGENGAKAKLQIIEWKKRFAGAGRLVFAGADGFELHEQPCGARSGGIPFTAYIVSPRFSALAQENAFQMDGLNPEIIAYSDAAKAAVKEHFALVNKDRSAQEVAMWIDEGSYPRFAASEENDKERARFDKLAVELSGRLEAFRDMTPGDRTILFSLLVHAMRDVKKGGLKEFLK